MKAVILAAGKGTRMRELTDARPKPMLLVQGRPILEHIIQGLVAAGIREMFIVTGFRADVIENYFSDGVKWCVRIAYGRQLVQDGTGKAPELAKGFVGPESFLLTYGDILVKPDTYRQMVRRFDEGKFSALVTATAGDDVTKGGLLIFDKEFCLKRLIEKPSATQLDELRQQGDLKPGGPVWYNAGIYIFRPTLFDFTAGLQKSPRDEYELTDAISAMLAAGHRIAGIEISGRWVDVRDPEVLASLEQTARTKPKVLILCTGNSARSHIAEGVLRTAAGDILEVHSAGSKPAGFVHPLAIKAMAEIGIDISQHRSKGMNEFLDQQIETVITVCGKADQVCPVYPGQVNRFHWPFDDPARAIGVEAEQMNSFRRVRDEIKAKFEAYAAERRRGLEK
jgi:thioredoxin type arsenate reductase